ncbi:site-specific DNA-methyltransferase [Catenibacterium mitsuokai]|uniref:site-specific DNA-methyltransferase n=1 Tax=Catenibacterium mitsuokai TaxID=100886 RepID=UPI0022E392FC|nr:site-specific DNA-methyltransferase [Catenibacterium mitsuokai]
MEKMRMESIDLIAQNVEKIAELFPNCVTETVDENSKLKKVINFDMLKQMLSEDVLDGDEAYEFTWVGKKGSIVEANKPIRKTLRPSKGESVDWNKTKNLYIEGDNLEVLKLLQESYLNKVKFIYIDPPYNTGNDFIYRDDYGLSISEYEDNLGMLDDDGNRLFKNTDSNGRFHSDWCSMMYSRLLLARNLLLEEGVIFISIDDGEVENLKKICDEVFGADNYINTISLKLKNIAGASGGGEDKRLKKNMEFILLYAKSYKAISQFENVYSYTPISEMVEQYRINGISWKYTTALVDAGEKVYIGSTVDGDGEEIKIYKRINYDIKSISAIMKTEKLTEKEAYDKYANCIFQTAMPQSSIRPRVMEKVKEIGIDSDLYSIEYVPKSGRNKGTLYEQFYKGENFRLFAWLRDVAEEVDGILYKKDLQGTLWDFVGETKNLTKEGDVPFPNGKKPVKLLIQMLKMITKEDDIVLDFFSGSATTAHATMQLNSEDGGHRKFIMVQLPEPCDEKSEAFKAGYKNICEIGKERIRRAGQKIKKENPLTTLDLDTGFRVLKIDDSNMTDVYYNPSEYSQDLLSSLESNIKPDRTDLDLLFGCLLEWGLPLSLPYSSEEIDGCTVHDYNDGDLIACFDENVPDSVVKAIAKKKPLRAVFRDSSFSDSPSKINVGEIFKLLAPDTRVKVI